MADNWIPTAERLPEDGDWKIVMTQNGTRYPARYRDKQWKMWSSLPNSGLVEQLMNGKVVYWQELPLAYDYVQCKCGYYYLKNNNQTECPICASFRPKVEEKPKQERKRKEKPPVEESNEVPFTDPIEAGMGIEE